MSLLANIRQRRGESLKDHCKRFNDVTTKVAGMSDESKLAAITLGLWKNTSFWNDLVRQ